jgi:hypothetical protein
MAATATSTSETATREVKDLKKEIGAGLLGSMLDDLGIDKEEL